MTKRLDSKDFVGQKFARLTVVGEGRRAPRYWLFQCDCGGEVLELRRDAVFNGNTNSCGCLHREILAARATHANSRVGGLTPEYISYRGMMSRCYYPRNTRFERYGARGITVCDRWRGNFEAFLADMGSKPSPSHSLDRIKNDLGYSPENCRWATPTEQARNRG